MEIKAFIIFANVMLVLYLITINNIMVTAIKQNKLKKGFAIVKHNGDVTSNPDVFNPGSEMEVILLDKSIKSTVKSKSNHNVSEFNL